ncbi:MAG: DNA-binding beta-propeller fold protein YncE, partial [Myxococcota bacterium]
RLSAVTRDGRIVSWTLDGQGVPDAPVELALGTPGVVQSGLGTTQPLGAELLVAAPGVGLLAVVDAGGGLALSRRLGEGGITGLSRPTGLVHVGGHVYVASPDTNDVTGYAVVAGGLLEPVADSGSSPPRASGPIEVAVTSADKVVAVDGSTDGVLVYSRNPTTGALAFDGVAESPPAKQPAPGHIVAARADAGFYTSSSDGRLARWEPAADGFALAGEPINSATLPMSLAAWSGGVFSVGVSGLRTLTATDAGLEETSNTKLVEITGMAVTSDGARLYAAGGSAGRIAAYDIGPDGALVEVVILFSGEGPRDVAVSPDGSQVLVTTDLGALLMSPDLQTQTAVSAIAGAGVVFGDSDFRAYSVSTVGNTITTWGLAVAGSGEDDGCGASCP